MGLFKPYDRTTSASEQKATTSGSAASSTASTAKTTAKKSIPTPSRKQAEQARRDRMQPVLTRKQSKMKEREARYRSRDESMAKANALPHNTMIRDWVDGRWNIAEFVLPLMLVVFATTIIGAYFMPVLTYVASYVIWGVFGILVLDVLLMWIGLRKQLRTHFPDEPLKGKLSYALSRSMMMRRSRQPAPRVKRGTKFAWPYHQDVR
ncbi:MAG: DUF3043 domain-containing protein [Propionibacteriaceae bacterium]|nr:DUF3043 domain-containing protein [Propionibacteriaceae bacterium]